MKKFGFTGTEPFSKTTRVKPAVIFRLCSNRSVPALLNPDFCTACFLGGGRSIQLSYADLYEIGGFLGLPTVRLFFSGWPFLPFLRRRALYPAELRGLV